MMDSHPRSRTDSTTVDSTTVDSTLFECLASARRRAVLGVLQAASEPLSTEQLAVRAVAALEDVSPDAVDDDERDRTVVSLRHCDLPKLDEAGLVDADDGADQVALGDHRALDESQIRDLLASAPTPSRDAAFDALASDRRRRVLAVLRESRRQLSRRELATRVAAREQRCASASVPEADVENVSVALHHTSLPKLAAAGFVAYDAADDAVAAEDDPALPADLLDLGDGPRHARA